MKVLKLQQNSEEWLEFRKGKSGGSEFKDIYVTGNPLKGAITKVLDAKGIEYKKTALVGELAGMLTPHELARLKLEQQPKERYYEMLAERIARPLTPNDYVDRLEGKTFTMMERGHILEPEALSAVSTRLQKEFHGGDVVWVREDNENIYISPDGWLLGDGGKITEAVEIKCPESSKVIRAFLDQTYPKEYFPQVCKYFIVNEDLQVLHFAIYTDLIPELELQIFDIKREDVANSLIEMKAFEDTIMERLEEDYAKIIGQGF